MLSGTVPFAGETAVDVMLKVVSEPVIPPRMKAPGIEITPEAEHLIMRALAKDPRQRQQSMEELYEELQRCYGSVRYRRSLESAAAVATPIPLQRVKRPGSGPFSEPIARVTPPGSIEVRVEGRTTGGAPILLTRRKERRKTLPMEPVATTGPEPPQPIPTPKPAVAPPVPAAAVAGGRDEWSEPTPQPGEENWIDLDVDAPDGTGG
jgi:serine/threonine protein kinase